MGSALDLIIMTGIDDLHENLVFAGDLSYDQSINHVYCPSVLLAPS
jgi:hypothetical protein